MVLEMKNVANFLTLTYVLFCKSLVCIGRYILYVNFEKSTIYVELEHCSNVVLKG